MNGLIVVCDSSVYWEGERCYDGMGSMIKVEEGAVAMSWISEATGIDDAEEGSRLR
jgi:hypothetical protein